MMAALFRPTEYIRPTSVRDALEILEKCQGKAKILAGGTDLMVKLPPCQCLVDITWLGLNGVSPENGGLKIGAAATMDTLAESSLVREQYTALAESARTVGSIGIRSMATVGGNICNASPAADTIPVLVALAAQVRVTSLKGERTMLLDEFVKGVGETDLNPAELLVEVLIPPQPERSGTAFTKLTRHQTKDDLAVVNAASRVVIDGDGKCLDVRICLGAVAPRPLRVIGAEQFLTNNVLTEATIDDASRMAVEETSPISDVRGSAEYRREMSRVLVKQTLIEAWRRSREDHRR